MPKPVCTIAILVNAQKQNAVPILNSLIAENRKLGYRLLLDRKLEGWIEGNPPLLSFLDEQQLPGDADCALVLGGDGSMIHAAKICSPLNVPILGINLGRVGYLADLDPGDFSPLKRLGDGDYRTENRMMLDASVFRGSEPVHVMTPALNDAVISNGSISRMVELSVSCDGQPVTVLHADGVIAATPTGSTAYSMSAGGPIVDPLLDCICMTPVCPHSISERPVLFSCSSTIEIENVSSRDVSTYLTVDGTENYQLLKGDVVRIRKSERSACLIRLSPTGFYSHLNRKIAFRNTFQSDREVLES